MSNYLKNAMICYILMSISFFSFGKQTGFNKNSYRSPGYFNSLNNILFQGDNASDYEKFKKESQEKIKENDKTISDLKEKMSKETKEIKSKYDSRIAKIEQKNNEMRKKIETCSEKKNNPKWEAFKKDFNKGMDELGKSIKDLTKDYNK